MFSINMLRMSIELSERDAVYEDMTIKFLEHFLYIAEAMTDMGSEGIGLWDDQDNFFYDVLSMPSGQKIPMRLRSMVGLIPLFAVGIVEQEVINKRPELWRKIEMYRERRPDLTKLVSRWNEVGAKGRRLFSLARAFRMTKLLRRMLDESEFLSPYGVRALSRTYLDHPYDFEYDGVHYRVKYQPGESDSGLFGGNSNWRGPIWMQVNYLLVENLRRFHQYYGDGLTVECPTGSGVMLTLERGRRRAVQPPAQALPARPGRAAPRLRQLRKISDGSPLQGLHSVLRVLPRRQWPRLWRFASDRLDRAHRQSDQPAGSGRTGDGGRPGSSGATQTEAAFIPAGACLRGSERSDIEYRGTAMALKNKVAIVTGGNSGIGQAIVLELARQGAAIVIDYVAHPEATAALEQQIAKLGDQSIGVDADVSKPADLQKLVDAAVKRFGRLDIMVNNAGIETRTSVLDTTEAQYDKVMNVNLKSAFFGTQIAASQMIKQGGGGRIINITSVHEDWPMPGNTAYCLAKGGMRMLTRTAGLELARHNILVVGVGPGAVATPINLGTMNDPAKLAQLDAAIPLGRMARPEEIASVVGFLAGDGASYLTATTIFADGGIMHSSVGL